MSEKEMTAREQKWQWINFVCWFSRKFFDIHYYPRQWGGDGLPADCPECRRLAALNNELTAELGLEVAAFENLQAECRRLREALNGKVWRGNWGQEKDHE